MGSRTDAEIECWQKEAGIEPAGGERAEILEALSKAAFEAIKIIELERSGIRDGDGFWHGSDVVGGTAHGLISLCKRLMDTYEPGYGERSGEIEQSIAALRKKHGDELVDLIISRREVTDPVPF